MGSQGAGRSARYRALRADLSHLWIDEPGGSDAGCMAALGALMRSDVLPQLSELTVGQLQGSLWIPLRQFSWADIAPLFDGMVAGARAGKHCHLRSLSIWGPNALDKWRKPASRG